MFLGLKISILKCDSEDWREKEISFAIIQIDKTYINIKTLITLIQFHNITACIIFLYFLFYILITAVLVNMRYF